MGNQAEELVEKVARALYPGEWSWIDRQRKSAQCYRDTPHDEAGFESREAAVERAAFRDGAADRATEWTLAHARRALAVAKPIIRDAALEDAATAAHVAIFNKCMETDGTVPAGDYSATAHSAILALKSQSNPPRKVR